MGKYDERVKCNIKKQRYGNGPTQKQNPLGNFEATKEAGFGMQSYFEPLG
jgi:hypothetical protein